VLAGLKGEPTEIFQATEKACSGKDAACIIGAEESARDRRIEIAESYGQSGVRSLSPGGGILGLHLSQSPARSNCIN